MKSIVCNVRDISDHDRQAIEHMFGEPLREHQQIVISLLSAADPDDIAAAERLRLKSPSSAQLREWAERCPVPDLANAPDGWT